MAFFGILCGFVIFLFLLYRYLTATYDFWKKRGIPGPDPVPIFGTMKDVMLKRELSAIHWKHLYDAYEDTSFIGLFNKREPVLLIKEPKHIKDVFIRDSSVFSTRGISADRRIKLLKRFLFFLDGPAARPLRAKLSPNFTPNRLKKIFSAMQESFTRFDDYMNALLSENNCVNCSDVTARLTGDIMGNSLLGTDMETLSTEAKEVNKFFSFSQLFPDSEKSHVMKDILRGILPQLYNLIAYRTVQKEKICFYTDFILNLIEYRKKHDIVKPDFVDLLMRLRDNPENLNEVIDMTDDHFYGAQIYGFFYGGYETSSTTMTNTLYELALNQYIQDKLRDEIRNFYSENGEITYDDINSMSYLNKVFKETLRKYPLVDSMLRKSSLNYIFRDTKLIIPKGQIVLIPIYAIHHDPKIYPKPEVYDPERFSDEAVQSRDPMYHIPFGNGIRGCIGERLGILQTKMGLIAFLRKYKVDVCEKTITSYKYNLLSQTLSPKDPIHLKVTKIDLF